LALEHLINVGERAEAVKKIVGPDKIVQEKVVGALARRRRDVSQN